MAGFAFANTFKLRVLQFESFSDELVQIYPARYDVPAGCSGGFFRQAEFTANRLENFRGEKSDLAFVIILKIKKTITPHTTAGDAFNFPHLDDLMPAGRLAMAPKKIVPRRNEKTFNADFQRNRHRIILATMGSSGNHATTLSGWE
jgi:hypothetical protein